MRYAAPKTLRRLLQSFVATMLFCALATYGQRNPRIGYAFPAGAQQGATFQMRLAGQYLDGVSGIVVTGGGVEASVVKHVKPMNGKELNLARDRAQDLQRALDKSKGEGSRITIRSESDTNHIEILDRAVAAKELATLRQSLANPKNRARENLQLSEDVVLAVRITEDALPGRRDLRLRTPTGLSNPVAFMIGNLPEYIEQEPNNKPGESSLVSNFPVVINGQISPGDVDRFRLRLRQGTKLVASVRARDLIPYLADAVPGWFQATLTLQNAKGHELAYQDDFQFRPDPVIYFEVPQDGEYVLEIKDALFRGREDFVYRLTAGELPYLTGLFPLGATAGSTTRVELAGWNLKESPRSLSPPASEGEVMMISSCEPAGAGNALPFALGKLPESTEVEPNNTATTAQQVTPALTVNGRIDPAGDHDVFSFFGKAGEQFVAEVTARRLGSPLDAILELRDTAGKLIAANDDFEDRASGLNTHHADSYLRIALPGDGNYFLTVADTQHKGGPGYGYRLRLSRPQPDFELRVTPSALNVRAGNSTSLTVYALRKDGFTNDIQIALASAPAGFKLSNGRLAGTNDQVKLTLSVPWRVPTDLTSISIEGRSTIAGQAVTRLAVPAEDMMQAFAYRHLVPAQELLVCVIGRGSTMPAGQKSAANPAKKVSK